MKKILIIEDEASLARILEYKLENQGFVVLRADDGENGLKLALKEKPDLILLDIIMPHMNGAQFLKKLRRDKWGKRAKVIVLTNVYDPEKMMEFSKGDVFDGVLKYYTKSDYNIDQFIREVKNLLG